MSIRDEVLRLDAYRFKAQPDGIKLDQNEFPADLPADVRAAALERIARADFHRYPEIHARSLRDAVARVDGWDPAGIVVAGGSNVLIQAIAILAAVGRRLVTVTPTFSVYGIQGRILAGELTEVPLGPGFSLPVDALAREVQRGSGVVFVANPAAPTGNLHPEHEIEAIVDAADPDRWLVVVDEAYWQFSGRNHAALVERHPHLLSLRTLSKAFGLGGVRLGYALTSAAIAAQLQKVVLPFSVSAVQAAVGIAALDASDRVEERVATIVAERGRLAARLRGMEGVEVFPSVTNFLLFRVADADRVYAALLDRGLIVRKQHGNPGLDGCLRVSVGFPDQNDRFLDGLAAVLREEKLHA